MPALAKVTLEQYRKSLKKWIDLILMVDILGLAVVVYFAILRNSLAVFFMGSYVALLALLLFMFFFMFHHLTMGVLQLKK